MKNKTEARWWTIRVESNREGAYVYNGSDFVEADDYIKVVEASHAYQREAELLEIIWTLKEKLKSARGWVSTHARQTYSRVADKECSEIDSLLDTVKVKIAEL